MKNQLKVCALSFLALFLSNYSAYAVDQVNLPLPGHFQAIQYLSLPAIFNGWGQDFTGEFKLAFVSVMNEWYRGKSGSSPDEEQMINRFITESKDKPVSCHQPALWKSTTDSSYLATAICTQEDFHITLIAWTNRTGKLVTSHFAGDKAMPVSITEVKSASQSLQLKGEQPYYEGEGTMTCLLTWDGEKFVASNYGSK